MGTIFQREDPRARRLARQSSRCSQDLFCGLLRLKSCTPFGYRSRSCSSDGLLCRVEVTSYRNLTCGARCSEAMHSRANPPIQISLLESSKFEESNRCRKAVIQMPATLHLRPQGNRNIRQYPFQDAKMRTDSTQQGTCPGGVG